MDVFGTSVVLASGELWHIERDSPASIDVDTHDRNVDNPAGLDPWSDSRKGSR